MSFFGLKNDSGQQSVVPEKGAKIMTVKEVTVYIKDLLSSDKILKNIWIRAEISNFHKHTSGHMYFFVKDEESVLPCAMFRNQNESLEFNPEDGMKVIARGSIDVYVRRGSYQLIVEEMIPEGLGELHLKFIQLRNKLDKEGLFSEKYKKELPKYPEKIGIVTSPVGNAIKDMLRVINQTYPAVDILISPATVQGEEAASTIIEAIDILNRTDVDVIIVGRGGGSLEDLWAFNEEDVARSIFRSNIPIVTGIGHEKDFTIADMVADYSAPTPTGAAQRIIPSKIDILKNLSAHSERMCQRVMQYVESQRAYLDRTIDRPIFNRPLDRIYQARQQLDDGSHLLEGAFSGCFNIKKQVLGNLGNKLTVLNPSSVLKRGYSITMIGKRIVKNTEGVETEDVLKTILCDGQIESKVKKIRRDRNAG